MFDRLAEQCLLLTSRLMRRLALIAISLALAAAACTYESSGVTTTTIGDPEDVVPATGPADIAVETQRVEGTSLTVASVTLPSDGWVVVRADDGGAPGQIIGISEILREGVVARVQVPFFVPITEDTTVHATIHVDLDRDGAFTYEAPDSLIDEIATFANGEAATAVARIELLPPLQPAEVTLEEQRTDGTSVVAAAAVLPAPGFVALMSNVQGGPGEVLAITELVPAGTVADIDFVPVPSLRVSGLVFLVVWIDRDEDGLFDAANDDIAVRVDGSLAQASAVMTVIPIEPASIDVHDQEGDGTTLTIDEVVLPGPGFILVLTDLADEPGDRLIVTESRPAGTHEEITIEFDEPLTEDTDLWVRTIIDFDEDGLIGPDDPFGLTGPGGEPATAALAYTIAEDE